MIRDLLAWLQTELGKAGADASSWSEQLLGTTNFWGLLEGTHLLGVMLFFGSIFIVDLNMLGGIFRKTSLKTIHDRILPLTIAGLVILVLTGLGLFFSKPLAYYHNIWFRMKLVVIALALVNVAVFHFRVGRDRTAWDASARFPLGARISAVVSLAAWITVICFGRLIAYSWLECGTPQTALINWAQDCASSEGGAVTLGSGAP